MQTAYHLGASAFNQAAQGEHALKRVMQKHPEMRRTLVDVCRQAGPRVGGLYRGQHCHSGAYPIDEAATAAHIRLGLSAKQKQTMMDNDDASTVHIAQSQQSIHMYFTTRHEQSCL